MADLLVLVEMSRSASRAASYAVSTGAPDADRLAHVAKSYCSDALTRVAAETVQLHGGIAITWEHDAQLVFKRAHALAQLFGAPHRHRASLDLLPQR
jgi:alkylation response protein AidB-like acyl-CoA dehydrogenase